MSTCGTGCHYINALSLKTELNCHVSCCHITDHQRNQKRIYPAWPFIQQLFILTLNGLKTSDTRADTDADPERIFLLSVNSGILQSFLCGNHCKLAELLHSLGRFRIHMLPGIKILYLGCKLCFVISSIKIGDWSDSYLFFLQAIPKLFHIITDWGDGTQTGHNHSPAHSSFSFIL